MLVRLTPARAAELPMEDLIEQVETLFLPYSPTEGETGGQEHARLSRTLDEAPELYRWLLQCWSHFDHWTDAQAEMWGRGDNRYKAMRERRDLFEKQASAMKLRYEAASRLITLKASFDESGMPRQRATASS